jgi:hypothetical protein
MLCIANLLFVRHQHAPLTYHSITVHYHTGATAVLPMSSASHNALCACCDGCTAPKQHTGKQPACQRLLTRPALHCLRHRIHRVTKNSSTLECIMRTQQHIMLSTVKHQRLQWQQCTAADTELQYRVTGIVAFFTIMSMKCVSRVRYPVMIAI